ncbi:uncharacterized protein LOC131874002 [Cryptomeria japonica]|uniref:uncharacterized protein LOC131874002 n=1 Tax=Cryptomeria japonica TaxID=3369 RepID=UPI0027DA3530|nr:uncharacterized protein LOC131874002 [Cryptomeria japonica]
MRKLMQLLQNSVHIINKGKETADGTVGPLPCCRHCRCQYIPRRCFPGHHRSCLPDPRRRLPRSSLALPSRPPPPPSPVVAGPAFLAPTGASPASAGYSPCPPHTPWYAHIEERRPNPKRNLPLGTAATMAAQPGALRPPWGTQSLRHPPHSGAGGGCGLQRRRSPLRPPLCVGTEAAASARAGRGREERRPNPKRNLPLGTAATMAAQPGALCPPWGTQSLRHPPHSGAGGGCGLQRRRSPLRPPLCVGTEAAASARAGRGRKFASQDKTSIHVVTQEVPSASEEVLAANGEDIKGAVPPASARSVLSNQ